MLPVIICCFTGVVLGAMVLGHNGWIIGGLFGFILGQVLRLSNKLEEQERQLTSLRAWQKKINGGSQAPLPTQELSSIQRVASAVETPAPPAHEKAENPWGVPSVKSVKGAESDTRGAEIPELTLPPELSSDTEKALPQWPQQAYRPTNAVGSVDPFEKLSSFILSFFTQGNPIVRVGMVIMFFGLSFLVKYASGHGFLPIELRLTCVAIIAMVLIGLGWKTRNKQDGYGLVLQGGGVASLYLIVFASAKLYTLMPTSAAFGIMFLLVILGTVLAILQNAQILALMATAGGFLTPILTSDGSGNHIGLFSFYLMLNIGILTIAWFKTWRLLNWVGFVFTFVITSAWGLIKYSPHLYASTEFFIIAFFVLYLLVSILFSIKQPPNLKGLVDGSLVFGLPIVGFGLQALLLKHTEYGLAISAVILASLYIALARWLWMRYQQTHRLLIESFIALAVGFATLAIPLALDAQWTSATWALEAIGLIWVGLRQGRKLPRVAGYLLHIAAAFSMLVNGIETGVLPILNGDFIGLTILSLSALCISWLMYQHTQTLMAIEKSLIAIPMIVGWIWWLVAGYCELGGHMGADQLLGALIVFFALSCLAILGVSRWIKWQQLASIGFWLLPLVAFWLFRHFGEALFIGYSLHPFQDFGWMAFLLFAGVQYRFLWRQRDRTSQTLVSVYHILSAWFLFCVIGWEIIWWQDHLHLHGTAAAMLWFAFIVVPLTALLVLTKKAIWPFTTYAKDYKNLIPLPLAFLLICWFLVASTYSGKTSYIYLPILNPLDLAQAVIVLVAAYIIKRNFLNLGELSANVRLGLMGFLAFVWINVGLLRAVHHYTGVLYQANTLWNSVVVQMALSILWSVCALAVMNLARRKQERKLWILGACLLGLVVIKLALKDLQGAGTLAGIVSFIVVGGLILLIGYISPIPAKIKPAQEEVHQ